MLNNIKFKRKNIECINFILLMLIASSCIGYFLLGRYLSDPLARLRGVLIINFISFGFSLIILPFLPNWRDSQSISLWFALLFLSPFYQLSLLYDFSFYTSFTRSLCWLILLASLLIYLSKNSRERIDVKIYLFFIAWLFINSFSLIGNYPSRYALMLYLIGVIIPGLSLIAFASFFKKEEALYDISNAITICIILTLVGMILVQLVAELVKYHDFLLSRKASDLTFGNALLFLVWPFIFWKYNSYSFFLKILVIFISVCAMLLSLSRTIIFLGASIILFSFIHRKYLANKKFLLSILITLTFISFILPPNISSLWLKRLNVKSWSSLLSINREKLNFIIRGRSTEGLRSNIWKFAYNEHLKKPIFGYGLGSFSTLISQSTGGKEAYSGAHNLILTVLVERGMIGFVFYVIFLAYLWVSLAWRYLTEAGDYKEFFRLAFGGYSCFLIFAHVTGIEAIRTGTLYIDGIISVVLMLYLLIAMNWKKIKKYSI